ncbi:MAG: hypothetical protein MRY21_04130 [Simkaniaceae bacterium]|nr:hypothetical protein [Simkaniaceae bacterium]
MELEQVVASRIERLQTDVLAGRIQADVALTFMEALHDFAMKHLEHKNEYREWVNEAFREPLTAKHEAEIAREKTSRPYNHTAERVSAMAKTPKVSMALAAPAA